MAQADGGALVERLPAGLSREQRNQLQATLERGIATIIEPEVAAERILAVVEADRFYALTHGGFQTMMVS